MYENLQYGVEATGLGKRFGDLWALRDVDLHVPSGTVLGLLGHNGAGKTTAIRILTTLAIPTTGSARVAGHDVVGEPRAVREAIGLAAQSATVDGLLTGRANLEMVGRLYHLGAAESRRRAGELLERLDLVDAADKLVKTYSGGMRRRLDLAASIVARPPVLFLDEPTTGLDPRSRNDLWALLRELVSDGVTIVLTTQYLEEADRLADEIVVLDHGRVVAQGTPAVLKQRVGGERVEVTLVNGDLHPAAEALAAFGLPETDVERQAITVPLQPGTRLVEVMRALDSANIDAHDISRREATLDDVFLSLTEAP
ncbi:MAG: type transport system ATP-binding protein [Solirubrobacteraceae bacterium]|jgi:ABC-2 type transport system ATP-binding protein|nr:type transport system ATP-binding protein [Solirubrobacteraceae bacterium]